MPIARPHIPVLPMARGVVCACWRRSSELFSTRAATGVLFQRLAARQQVRHRAPRATPSYADAAGLVLARPSPILVPWRSRTWSDVVPHEGAPAPRVLVCPLVRALQLICSPPRVCFVQVQQAIVSVGPCSLVSFSTGSTTVVVAASMFLPPPTSLDHALGACLLLLRARGFGALKTTWKLA